MFWLGYFSIWYGNLVVHVSEFPHYQQSTVSWSFGNCSHQISTILVYYLEVLTVEKCCQCSHFSLSGGPWHTRHVLKNLQRNPPSLFPFIDMGRLQLPLTFRWISLPPGDWLKTQFGSAGSVFASPALHPASILYCTTNKGSLWMQITCVYNCCWRSFFCWYSQEFFSI